MSVPLPRTVRSPSRRLDLDLVGGEEFAGLGDRCGEHLVEVDHVEGVGGAGQALPCLLLGAGADAAGVGQVQAEHQRRYGEQQAGVDPQDEHGAGGHQETQAETGDPQVEVVAELLEDRCAGGERDDRDREDVIEDRGHQVDEPQQDDDAEWLPRWPGASQQQGGDSGSAGHQCVLRDGECHLDGGQAGD